MVVGSSAVAGVPRPAKLPAAITMSADRDLVSRLCMNPPAVDGEDRLPPFAVSVGSRAVDFGPYHRGEGGVGPSPRIWAPERRRRARLLAQPRHPFRPAVWAPQKGTRGHPPYHVVAKLVRGDPRRRSG